METTDSIYFFGENNPYGFLSNFYPSSFSLNNQTFNCSEQYFMYQKALTFDKSMINLILKETNPKEIKKYGRQIKNFKEDIWNQIRIKHMKDGIKAKFTQNLKLKELLLQTKPKQLYEASKFDRLWGIGFFWQDAIKPENYSKYGNNFLGKILMEVREELDKKMKI